ncbi:Cullin-domain-containing protein [Apodospora peruviana]|uniref:Cullin-domain-containing protein n=1 Tax=Apodospora peruviana TaxID=516989 RepID=A0AAE0ICP7_9PEZI|nr:Cullin-domain-containing protein [Apodospora peruviana]
MQSITSEPSFDGAAVPPPPPPPPPASSSSSAAAPTTATATTPPKRRHRVDSNPSAQWSPSSTAPDPKRARSFGGSSSSGTYTTTAMSARVQGKRPEVIDLTHSAAGNSPSSRKGASFSSSGQHHIGGARKLVIKNLRTSATNPTRAASVDEYFVAKRKELDDALSDIFAWGSPAKHGLDRLYRGVEDLCRKGEAAELAERLWQRCEAHLNGVDVLGRIRSDGGVGDDVALLRSVLAHWKAWTEKLLVIRWIYSYLDRSFLLNNKTAMRINDKGISSFRRMVFGSKKDLAPVPPPVGGRVLAAMCQLVDYDRRNDECFESAMLKDSITMLRLFGVYGKQFEPQFLGESHQYFVNFAEERNVSYGLKDYIIACERLLQREDERCDGYNFDSTTKRQLRDDAHDILVEKYSDKLLEGGSVGKLLDANDVESMRALYRLLKLSGIQKRLKGPWEDYIREAGAAIVSDTTRGDEMVIRLLELRRSLDIMIRDAFEKDEDFTYGLREAFGYFINNKKVLSKWNTGTSKVGEMIAKYIDMLLRGGLKTIPKSLLSDSKDRADAERSGLASTGDEDAELDRQLDHGLELFRFIEGKDVFEAFYKRDLARRLLMGRSASQDAERNMLSKLKSECGSSFTHNLEQMFKDQELAKDEMKSYKEWMTGTGRTEKNSGVDLTVNILSAAAWPSYPDVRVLLPKEVLEQITTFDSYYKNKHTGRRLTWMHNLAHCVVRAQFNRGPKELQVSAFQAVVLVLFNDVEDRAVPVLSYEQISQATGMAGGELERTLQSLACGKVRVLTKHPKGRDVNKTDTFTVNKAFTDPKYRVKINQIQLKETNEENQETHQRVAADRQFETQAAIVRIMKSRKTMTHLQLVTEVINQTRSRGALDAGDIKMNIEKLIEKDYIEREGGSYTYLA